MDFIRELRKVAFDTASQNGIITDKVTTNIQVRTSPLDNCIEHITEEILQQYTNGYASISPIMEKWFARMVEGGMVIAIATQFDNNNTMQLKPRKIDHKVAFSFHINFHLEHKKEAFDNIYTAINQFVIENEDEINTGTLDKIELINTVLLAGALIAIELCNRIEIRKEDFLAIHHELEIKDDELDDLDYEDEEYSEDEDDEMVDEDEDSYSVYCPFCAQPNLFQSKKDKGLKQTEIVFCDHLALGFVTNAETKIVGIDYYIYYLEKAIKELSETTDSEDVYEFSKELDAFYSNYSEAKESSVIQKLKSNLPEHKNHIKQFVANIEGSEHRFVFHYLKLLKQHIN